MWENPVTYAVVLGTKGSLVSIGIWTGRMNSFKGSVENTLAEIKESINNIQYSVEKILFRLPPD